VVGLEAKDPPMEFLSGIVEATETLRDPVGAIDEVARESMDPWGWPLYTPLLSLTLSLLE
jgi:hypothetical protein